MIWFNEFNISSIISIINDQIIYICNESFACLWLQNGGIIVLVNWKYIQMNKRKKGKKKEKKKNVKRK